MSVNLVASLIKQVLPKLIEAASAWAAETDAKWDDFAVSLLRFLYESEEFRLWLAELIVGEDSPGAPQQLQFAAAEHGFDWSQFMEALPLIIALVRAAIGK